MSLKIKTGVNLDELRKYGFKFGKEWAEAGRGGRTVPDNKIESFVSAVAEKPGCKEAEAVGCLRKWVIEHGRCQDDKKEQDENADNKPEQEANYSAGEHGSD